MKKAFRGEHLKRFSKSALIVFIGLALTAGIWMAMAPAAKAKEITPAEMIQSKLPPSKTLASASKPEILSAISAAITKWPNEAPLIVRTAAGARKDMTFDILKRSIQCLRDDPKSGAPSCDLVGQTVAAAISANAEEASKINDLALQLSPDCREAIENAGTPTEGPDADPPNLNPPPGSLGGGGGTTNQQNSVTVCDHGQNVQVPSSHEQSYLAGHPGSQLGACQATPDVNK